LFLSLVSRQQVIAVRIENEVLGAFYPMLEDGFGGQLSGSSTYEKWPDGSYRLRLLAGSFLALLLHVQGILVALIAKNQPPQNTATWHHLFFQNQKIDEE
jgi:hypothetical protein